jgi:hypothetical protein
MNVVLGGEMTSVLAIRPKVCVLSSGRTRWISKGDKNPNKPFFGKGGGEAVGPCSKILHHVKITCNYEQKYFLRPNLSFPSPVPHACYQIVLLVELPENSVEEPEVFPCRYHSTMVFHTHISPGG